MLYSRVDRACGDNIDAGEAWRAQKKTSLEALVEDQKRASDLAGKNVQGILCMLPVRLLSNWNYFLDSEAAVFVFATAPPTSVHHHRHSILGRSSDSMTITFMKKVKPWQVHVIFMCIKFVISLQGVAA